MRAVLARFAIIGALVVTACAPAPAVQPGASAPGQGETRAANQTLRIGTNFFVSSASPETSTGNIDQYSLQFDSLLRFDKEFNLIPSVATAWEWRPEGAWRFTIRRDLQFSNGDRLTAEDVAFTFNQAVRGRWAIWIQTPIVTGARVVDESTVDVQVTARDVSVIFTAPGWFIHPQRYYEQVGAQGFQARPIGSGPYVLAEYRPNDLAVYRLRENYRHPFRQVTLTEVTWRNIPEPQTIVTGLRTGDLDMGIGTFAPDNAKAAQDAGMTVYTNQASYNNILFYWPAIQNTPMADRRVRLAMNYAVNKEALSRAIYSGFSEPIGQLAVPGAPNFVPEIRPIPFNQAEARRLLAEAGYPNGFRVQGGLDFSSGTVANSLFQAIQSMHREVGIIYDLHPLELGIYRDTAFVRNGRVPKEMISAGGSNTNGVFTFSWGFLRCDKTPPESVLFCVPGMDDAMRLALAELDRDARNRHLQNAMRAWVNEVPMIFLTTAPQYRLASRTVRGFEWTTQTYYTLDSVYRVN
ncbi:MAG: ABC transporter substrate-binding protein [Dehalococcoidia bacterium]|nr:ABC transporter substrate-binding protein [Dehalococcoidia bacterium]